MNVFNKLAFIALALAFFVIISCGSNSGEFLLENKSGKMIKSVSISISGQNILIKNLHQNQSSKGHYPIKSDSHFDISVLFASGEIITTTGGYITKGVDYQDVITITQNEILISSKVK